MDDVIVAAGPGPQGHPIVDLTAHGGIRVVERILMSLQASGVELGDSTAGQRHAWPARNHIEAEVFAAVCRAQTRRAVKFLMHQSEVLTARLEVLADQAETDTEATRSALGELVNEARGGRFLVEGATIALVGPPNAGKSTLANRLFGAPMAVVSPTPGTTLDWVAEPSAINGIPVTLMDTAGIGTSDDETERLAIQRGRARAAEADLVLVVLDGAAPWPEDFCGGFRADTPGQPTIPVISKSDLRRQWGDGALPEHWAHCAVPVSALTGSGTPALEERVAAGLQLAAPPDSAPRFFTDRQRRVTAELLAEPARSPADSARRIRDELIGWPPRRPGPR